MKIIRHLDLFSGIGGFALALQEVYRGGYRNVGFCDNDLFCQAIIKKHFSKSKIYGDIKELKGKEIGPVDIITGGFPCQPFSAAGKRKGTKDDRHLWPEMLRIIRETSPRWIVAENVGGILTWNGGLVFERVLADLENAGYQAWPFVLPACSQNAPHRRDRVWIIAHANGCSNGRKAGSNARSVQARRLSERNKVGKFSQSDSVRFFADSSRIGHRGRGSEKYRTSERLVVKSEQKRNTAWSKNERRSWNAWPKVAARLCRMDDGLSKELDKNPRLKSLGNAIVPQVAIKIFQAISQIDK